MAAQTETPHLLSAREVAEALDVHVETIEREGFVVLHHVLAPEEVTLPPHPARRLSPRVRELLGYSIAPPFMGYVNGLHPQRLLEPDRTQGGGQG